MEDRKFDISQGLAAGLIAAFGLSVALFAAFVLQRAVAPPVNPPVVWHNVTSVKPDAVYAERQAAPPARDTAAPPDDQIIYYAPPSATLPVLVTRVDAALPKSAQGGCEHSVPMLITINPQGKPINPAFREPPGCGMDAPALQAVMNWRFRPAQLEGKNVPVGALVDVKFR